MLTVIDKIEKEAPPTATREEIIAAVLERVEEAEGQVGQLWFAHNDGVLRGLLWALTGLDPGTRLFSRVEDIYKTIGAQTKQVADHIHYALPGRPDSDLDECDICNPPGQPKEN